MLISKAVDGMTTRIEETVTAFMEKGHIPRIDGEWYADYLGAVMRAEKSGLVGMYDILTSCPDYHAVKNLKITSKDQVSFHGKMDFFYDCVSRYKKTGFSVIVLAGTDVKAQNLTEALNDININAVYEETLEKPPKSKEIIVTKGELNNGFEYPLVNVAVVSDREIFGSVKKVRRKKSITKKKDKKGKLPKKFFFVIIYGI